MMTQNLTEATQGILILNSSSMNFSLNNSICNLNEIYKNPKINQQMSMISVSKPINKMKTFCNLFNFVPSNIAFQQFFVNSNESDDQSKKRLKKVPFTHQEDKLLLQLVSTYGKKDWKTISLFMQKNHFYRSVRQCKDRYFHYLDPKISQNSEWTKEEDELLLSKVVEMGNKWKSMENIFPGRTEISLRNRYSLLLRKNSKDERRKNLKKKNIISNEISFLSKLDSEHSIDHKNNNGNIKNNEKIMEINHLNEENIADDDIYHPFSINSDLFFNESIDQESTIWLDDKYSNDDFCRYY